MNNTEIVVVIIFIQEKLTYCKVRTERKSSEFHALAKDVSDLFRVAVDGVEQKRKSEAENGTGEKGRENGNLLPADFNPRIDEEADCQHDKCHEACIQHKQLVNN